MSSVPLSNQYRQVLSVAASDAPTDQRSGVRPQFQCTGTNDEVQIQAAVNALQASGGGVLNLSAGTFKLSGPSVQISSSNVVIQGQGFGTIIDRAWVQGTSPLYMFEIKGADDNNRLVGCGVHGISVRTDAPYAQTPAGFIGDGTQSFLFARYVDHFQASRLFAKRVAFIVDVRNASNVIISSITGEECFGPVSVITTQRVAVDNIVGDKVETVVDFGDVQHGTINNILGKASTARNEDEGIDCGGSQGITISNFDLDGFYRGIYLKQELAPGPKQVNDINISNGVIKNSVLHGIRCYNVIDLTARYGPLKIDNVEIVGSGTSTGITVVDYGIDVQITNNILNVGGVGIQVDGSQGVTIDNNRIKTGVSDNGITCRPVITTGGSGVDALSDYTITNNRVAGGKIGIYCEKITGLRVAGNNVSGCAEHGMHLLDIRKPRVHGNEVDSVQREGIWVQWIFDTFLDSVLRKINAKIGENTVSDFGLEAGTAWNGVFVQISGITGAAYNDLSVNNNDCILTNAANPTLQQGVRIDFTIDLDYASIQGNLLNVPGASFSSRNTILPNCKVRDNVGAADVV